MLTGAGQRPFVSKTQRRDLATGKARIAGLIFVEFCLEPDTMIETEGGWQTFDQLEKGKAQHLRCQAMFRPDSTSWAAFFGRHADGGGFIFDEGTRTKYCLSRTRAKASWEVILDHVIEDLGPTERDWRDRVKSSARGRWIAEKEVRRDPVVLELLERASDAPVLKSGMVDRSRLPQRYNAYLPFAWGRLLSMLPEHGRIDAALARLLGTMVGGNFAGGHDSCSLGHWAWRCARSSPGKWRRVGTFAIWGHLADGALQIALWPSVVDQVLNGRPGGITEMIADINGDRLTRAVKQAGIGTEDNRFNDHDAEGKQRRATILSAAFSPRSA